MFDLVNLHEEEEFIRNALIGNIYFLSLVLKIYFIKIILGWVRYPCRLKGFNFF